MVTNSIYCYNYFIISTVENVKKNNTKEICVKKLVIFVCLVDISNFESRPTNVKNSINCYNSIGAYVHFCGNLDKLKHFSFPANEI